MKDRCYNKNSKDFKNYGGRGIEVCPEWRNSYKRFHADMHPRPDGASLDRIDNDGMYSVENCRWASAIEQGNNRRTNAPITYEGLTLTLPQWAKKLDIPIATLKSRRHRGLVVPELFSPEDLNESGALKRSRKLEHNGECLTIKEWSLKIGVSSNAIHQRLHRKWPMEKVLMPCSDLGRQTQCPSKSCG